MSRLTNVLQALPLLGADRAGSEQFCDLLRQGGVRIERIVSTGQASPAGFWYDQPKGEWVLVVQGEARLRFADEPVARDLRAGDFLDIAPHRRHRVEWTSPDRHTIWLAVHYAPPAASARESVPAFDCGAIDQRAREVADEEGGDRRR